VVADLRLQDLSGLQLLNQVMTQWPKSHRLVLADPGDLDALVRCVGGVHQFLTRPCDAQRLLAVLARAFKLDAWLPNDTVRKLLGRLPFLPSHAEAYHAVVARLEGGHLDEAAERIGSDPAMAAKILQLANSAAWGPPLDEANPSRAARELGLPNVRRTLLLSHTYSGFRDLEADGFSIQAFVAHARRTGEVARRIAEAESAPAETVAQAATAGLLHDLGKLALAVNLPHRYRAALKAQAEAGTTSWEAEQEVYGATHGEVGGSLLAIWSLPLPVIEAVAFHHLPACFLSRSFSPLTAVHVANAFAGCANLEAARSRLDLGYLGTIHADQRLPVWWSCYANPGAVGDPS
jgi:HD-like signal output (HDOD) protein